MQPSSHGLWFVSSLKRAASQARSHIPRCRTIQEIPQPSRPACVPPCCPCEAQDAALREPWSPCPPVNWLGTRVAFLSLVPGGPNTKHRAIKRLPRQLKLPAQQNASPTKRPCFAYSSFVRVGAPADRLSGRQNSIHRLDPLRCFRCVDAALSSNNHST